MKSQKPVVSNTLSTLVKSQNRSPHLAYSAPTRLLTLAIAARTHTCATKCCRLTFRRRVAGNIARDNAKNLKIEEYNALFGVTEDAPESAAQSVAQSAAQAIAQAIASSFQQRMLQKQQEKAKKRAKARKEKATARRYF